MVELAGVDSERVSTTVVDAVELPRRARGRAARAAVLHAGLQHLHVADRRGDRRGRRRAVSEHPDDARRRADHRDRSSARCPTSSDQFGVGVDSSLAHDLRPSFPFLVLFLLLVFWPRAARAARRHRPARGRRPAAARDGARVQGRRARSASRRSLFLVFMVGFLVVMMTLVSPLWVSPAHRRLRARRRSSSRSRSSPGFGGQISLAQATFAGVGGFTHGERVARSCGIPVLVAHGARCDRRRGRRGVRAVHRRPAALIGRSAAPVPRLGGIYLSLATLAFALMAEHVIFNREEVSHGQFGVWPSAGPTSRPATAMWFLVVFGDLRGRRPSR